MTARGALIVSPVILNFAYGSNMLTARLRERVPSTRAIGVGMLRGHELRWHQIGKDGSGKCDVARTGRPQSIVFGVIHDSA